MTMTMIVGQSCRNDNGHPESLESGGLSSLVDVATLAHYNIHSWISLSGGDLAFNHQHGICGFKFPERFLEISSRDLTLFSLLSILII